MRLRYAAIICGGSLTSLSAPASSHSAPACHTQPLRGHTQPLPRLTRCPALPGEPLAQVDGTRFLGSSGQPIEDMAKYSRHPDRLTLLQVICGRGRLGSSKAAVSVH